MKTIKFAAYLFYKYYSTGYTKQIPYFSTLCGLAMIVLLHLFQIAILANQVDVIFPFKYSDNIFKKYFLIGLVLLPIFLVLKLFVKENELQQMTFSKEKVKSGYIFLIAYIVLSMASLILLIIFFPRSRPN